jgi:quercetin dioxygenase-like cupin family protein
MNTIGNKLAMLVVAGLALSHVSSSIAQEASASAILVPSDLKWSESPRAPGVATAAIVGEPSKPGPYVFRAKYPPNTVNRPHHHPEHEEITVLSGTLYFGDGLAMEPEKTRVLPAGSHIAVPAKSWHFLLTRSEPVELEIRGVGPRTNVFAK